MWVRSPISHRVTVGMGVNAMNRLFIIREVKLLNITVYKLHPYLHNNTYSIWLFMKLPKRILASGVHITIDIARRIGSRFAFCRGLLWFNTDQVYRYHSGPLFTNVFPQDLVKSRSRGVGVKIFQFLRKLTGTSSAALPRCLSNFRAIRSLQHPISRPRDFTRSCGKTPVRLVNRCPCLLH